MAEGYGVEAEKNTQLEWAFVYGQPENERNPEMCPCPNKYKSFKLNGLRIQLNLLVFYSSVLFIVNHKCYAFPGQHLFAFEILRNSLPVHDFFVPF